jgi:hypothetical protein
MHVCCTVAYLSRGPFGVPPLFGILLMILNLSRCLTTYAYLPHPIRNPVTPKYADPHCTLRNETSESTSSPLATERYRPGSLPVRLDSLVRGFDA